MYIQQNKRQSFKIQKNKKHRKTYYGVNIVVINQIQKNHTENK